MPDDDLRPEYNLASLVPVPPEEAHFRNRPTLPGPSRAPDGLHGVSSMPDDAGNLAAQKAAAALIMVQWDEHIAQAAAACGFKVVRGIGAMADCVFLTLGDPAAVMPTLAAHAYLFIHAADGGTHVAVPGSYDVHTHTYATHCGFPHDMGPHSGRFHPVVASSAPPDSLCKPCAAAAGIDVTAVPPEDDPVIDNKAEDDPAVRFVRDFVALFRDSDMRPEDECRALYARATAILAADDTNLETG